MKRIVSFVLSVVFLFVFASCSQGNSPVEEAMLAVRKMDLNALESLLTTQTRHVVDPMRDYDKMMDEKRQEVLLSLYALLRYTIEQESEPENGEKRVTLSLTMPDMMHIQSLAEMRILVSGESAYEVIDSMLQDGAIAKNHMIRETVEVRLKQQEGEWRIPYTETENAVLVRVLRLTEMLRFLAQH